MHVSGYSKPFACYYIHKRIDPKIVQEIKAARLIGLGHQFRTDELYPGRKITFTNPDAARKLGRPPVKWMGNVEEGRSQWPRGLRRRSSAARLLRLWVRIPPGTWMFVCCECCVLSGKGLWDGLITRPGESYRLWRVVVCDQETSKTRRLKPATGL